ncbi:hypothetical protein IFM12275_18790 [Nocardia sputorum]|uniref:Uncharacterized protein n=1 Tax=Nocardia sputorum TaxID=2984338 RepID=A0ABM8CZF3_9NOCA|nr:hypothetical protein IFM12275_18790 [Nocardia sputorum]BDU00429.1 hypothetical protein IFM12276_34570 [Nocardia sputorum]
MTSEVTDARGLAVGPVIGLGINRVEKKDYEERCGSTGRTTGDRAEANHRGETNCVEYPKHNPGQLR